MSGKSKGSKGAPPKKDPQGAAKPMPARSGTIPGNGKPVADGWKGVGKKKG